MYNDLDEPFEEKSPYRPSKKTNSDTEPDSKPSRSPKKVNPESEEKTQPTRTLKKSLTENDSNIYETEQIPDYLGDGVSEKKPRFRIIPGSPKINRKSDKPEKPEKKITQKE